MVGHQGCLRAIGQIHPGNRVGGRQQPAQPGKLVVTVAVSPGQADPAGRDEWLVQVGGCEHGAVPTCARQ
jgi:hypothetical protein